MTKSSVRRKEQYKRYHHSSLGQSTRRAWRSSEAHQNWLESEEGKESARKARENYVRQHSHAKRRAEAIRILGNKCCKCGFSDIRALQIDHINPVGRFREGNATIHRRIRKGDLSFQLLCANCNWIKRVENEEHKNTNHAIY